MAFTLEVREWEQAVSRGETRLGLADWMQAELRTARSKSPLVQLVEGFEQVQRIQKYLYATTFTRDGMGSMPRREVAWTYWYDAYWYDVASAIKILRECELSLRHDIAKRVGATLNK